MSDLICKYFVFKLSKDLLRVYSTTSLLEEVTRILRTTMKEANNRLSSFFYFFLTHNNTLVCNDVRESTACSYLELFTRQQWGNGDDTQTRRFHWLFKASVVSTVRSDWLGQHCHTTLTLIGGCGRDAGAPIGSNSCKLKRQSAADTSHNKCFHAKESLQRIDGG